MACMLEGVVSALLSLQRVGSVCWLCVQTGSTAALLPGGPCHAIMSSYRTRLYDAMQMGSHLCSPSSLHALYARFGCLGQYTCSEAELMGVPRARHMHVCLSPGLRVVYRCVIKPIVLRLVGATDRMASNDRQLYVPTRTGSQ